MPSRGNVADMATRAVSIADLKNNLSTHLARVRAGEEVPVRDRQTPIAKIWAARAPRISTDRALEILREDREARCLPPLEAPPS